MEEVRATTEHTDMGEKKANYMKKTIVFNGKVHTLFSLNGETWSSRKEELSVIQARHENEKEFYGSQIKGGAAAKEVLKARREAKLKLIEAKRKAHQAEFAAQKKAVSKELKSETQKQRVLPLKNKKQLTAKTPAPAPKKRGNGAVAKKAPAGKRRKAA